MKKKYFQKTFSYYSECADTYCRCGGEVNGQFDDSAQVSPQKSQESSAIKALMFGIVLAGVCEPMKEPGGPIRTRLLLPRHYCMYRYADDDTLPSLPPNWFIRLSIPSV